ncbi:hypothetical protein EDB85DRAFT_1862721, partial [Lactarius pseudohatsudake]
WLEEEDVPGFKTTFEWYLAAVECLSYEFVRLVAEALGLAPDVLARFFDARERMQHHAKLLKYPTRDEAASEQGIGPHFDAGFMTFLLLASDHPGLQAQNLSGQWIKVSTCPYIFIINFGKVPPSVSVTQGLARATSHRVLVPPAGPSLRYSIPSFRNIAQGVRLSEHALVVPPEVLRLIGRRGELGQTYSVNFSEYDTLPSGQVSLIQSGQKFHRSHPNVAEKHYPELFKQFFPYGIMPTDGTAD